MIRGKRAFLASVLQRSGLVTLNLRVRRRLAPTRLTVINYHRVDDVEGSEDVDEGCHDATVASFERQVEILSREFNLITLAQLSAHLQDTQRQGTRLPPNPALITFDDGYLDNFEKALPVLERYQAPASFFIATDYLTQRRVFWWDRISYLVKRCRQPRIVIEYPRKLELDMRRDRAASTETLLDLVKQTHALDLERFLAELTQASGVEWDATLEKRLADRLLMSWDQVRELKRRGMDVGSHTRTHRVLGTLRSSELESELCGSRDDLERELGVPVSAIAYPVGPPIAHVPELRRAVQAAGYQVGFSYGTGFQSLRRIDPFDVRRMAVERPWSDERFRAAVTYSWAQ